MNSASLSSGINKTRAGSSVLHVQAEGRTFNRIYNNPELCHSSSIPRLLRATSTKYHNPIITIKTKSVLETEIYLRISTRSFP